MRGNFSLATLLLLIAIAAVGLASIRTVPDRPNDVAAVTMVAGGACGMLFAMVLALWNRVGFLRMPLYGVGGAFLGAAAGAQMSVSVHWPVMIAGPILLLTIVWLIAITRRPPRHQSSTRPEIIPPD